MVVAGGIPGGRGTALVALVLVNLLPLALVAGGWWEAGDVLAAYWLENVVIGGYTVGKIITARGSGGPTNLRVSGPPALTRAVRGHGGPSGRVALAGFFTLHFGIFTLVHGVFTALIAFWIGTSSSFGGWVLLALGLVVSHGVSFVVHWWHGGERDRTSPGAAMMAPYARIFVLHVVVLLGAFVLFRGFSGFGSSGAAGGDRLLPVAILVVLKTGVDVVAHLRQHRVQAADDLGDGPGEDGRAPPTSYARVVRNGWVRRSQSSPSTGSTSGTKK